ncbi:GGDEF domain-containing protein [Paenibacillus xanthanilyticus]|uniref:GGDEF domain-containing protein n=1 Tax=Paenibacillus xanthanilyticus TaxID=1783531 RepID=A0ABV8KAA9_9BACL
MNYENLDYNRARWNRMLLNGFWSILIITFFLECLYLLTVAEVARTTFITEYIVRPTIILLGILLSAESGIKLLRGKYQDYIMIITSAMLSAAIVYIHDSINYLLLALFLPVMVSIFYFHMRKLVFAFCVTITTLYVLYAVMPAMNAYLTAVSLTTISIMFLLFTLIAGGILMRGRELMTNLQTYFESNRDLMVKNVWMDKLSKTDALTDLYNHITFHEFFERLIEQHECNEVSVQLALIDIDNFKQINDTYGHRAGDAVLTRVAETIRANVNANAFVARYGGEEFAVLFTDITFEEAYEAVESIRNHVSRLPHEQLGGRSVTVSIGIGDYARNEGKEHFFHLVDEALYEAKHTGKNRTVVPSKETTQASQLA